MNPFRIPMTWVLWIFTFYRGGIKYVAQGHEPEPNPSNLSPAQITHLAPSLLFLISLF